MENDDKKKKTTTVKKANTSKSSVVKKTPTKKTVKKDSAVKKTPKKEITTLNETTIVQEEVKNKVEPKNLNEKECEYCHKTFAKEYSICPHCRKSQKKRGFIIFFIFIAIILLGTIIIFHFVEKTIGKKDNLEQDYKKTCVLVDFENLVRHPKEYRNKDVKVIGEVIDVNGYDDGFGNNMEITINANQFDNGVEQIITISYHDKDYSQGFLTGDIVTVYGKYVSINGNIPNIEAKYILFEK